MICINCGQAVRFWRYDGRDTGVPIHLGNVYFSCDLDRVGDPDGPLAELWPAPDKRDALSFDEVEAAGLDGTLRSIG